MSMLKPPEVFLEEFSIHSTVNLVPSLANKFGFDTNDLKIRDLKRVEEWIYQRYSGTELLSALLKFASALTLHKPYDYWDIEINEKTVERKEENIDYFTELRDKIWTLVIEEGH